MKNFDFIICGNNIGAMVAAIELSKTHTIALVNPTPNWGAHFAGIKMGGHSFDIGMNFFEFDSFYQPGQDLMTYSPEVRNDSARFFLNVKDFFESRMELVESHDQKTLVNGIFGKDIIIANEVAILHQLPVDTQNKIREELTKILSKDKTELHASNKKTNDALFLNTGYKAVSLANHGETFHNLFIEPLCDKIFNMSSADVPALFHRIPWAPLFYPETLLAALNDPNFKLTPTLFHYPKANYFSKALETVLEEIKANPAITIVSSKITSLEKSGSQYVVTTAEHTYTGKLVWGNDLSSLLAYSTAPAAPAFEKASITVAFLIIKTSAVTNNFSTLFVCDGEDLVYRVSNQNICSGLNEEDSKISIELNFDKLSAKGITGEQEIKDYVWQFLTASGCIAADAAPVYYEVKSIKNAVNLPTLNNFNNFKKNQELTLQNFKDVELIGPASGFVSTSFNCQVVQGLKLGVKYKNYEFN